MCDYKEKSNVHNSNLLRTFGMGGVKL